MWHKDWLGRAMVLGSFQCRGILLLWHMVGHGPAVLAAGAGRVGCFLAHLSRRLTRWAYSIAMVRRPSVVVRRRRRPHFQTCISLKPAGQPRSNFMCSITGMGERLHKVFGQIRSKLVSMATESPHWVTMGKTMSPPFLGCFWSDLFYTCR